ncbi:MAG: DUF134 domain-containing protein [Candidatus Bathyarchaeia archaeon]
MKFLDVENIAFGPVPSRRLGRSLGINGFTPDSPENMEPIFLELAELEAFRLVDLEGLSQEEAGQKMGVSRGTIWRLVQRARRKTAQALSEGRPLYIMPTPEGNY